MSETVTKPKVKVESDYDGYFADMVDRLIEQHRGPFNHKKIVVSAGPYRPYAVTYTTADDTIHLDFYSALRAGFGFLGDEEFDNLAQLL